MSRCMCKSCISGTVQLMEFEWSDLESDDSDDAVQFMEVEGTDHDSVESNADAVQFMEVEGTENESVESDDPNVQQSAAPAFAVVCEELGDLIMARLPVRDVVRTRSVCKYLRACSLQLSSKSFRRWQLEAGVTEVTDWYFPTSGVGIHGYGGCIGRTCLLPRATSWRNLRCNSLCLLARKYC